MRRVLPALAVALLVASCSSKSPDELARERIANWPETFCSLEIGMTRDEVRELMGRPTDEGYSTDVFAEVDEYKNYSWQLYIIYTEDDLVDELLGEPALELPCKSYRF